MHSYLMTDLSFDLLHSTIREYTTAALQKTKPKGGHTSNIQTIVRIILAEQKVHISSYYPLLCQISQS